MFAEPRKIFKYFLSGKDVGLNQGDAHPLLMHAAEHGLRPAQKMVKEVCVNGGCDI